MRKFYLILSLMLSAQLVIGQFQSLLIKKNKSDKEYIINEGEKIKVKVNWKKTYEGNLKLIYDSSKKHIQLQVENYDIPLEEVKSILSYKNNNKRIRLKQGKGYGLLAFGIPLEILSIFSYHDAWCCEELFVAPIVISGLMTTLGVVRLVKTKRKYEISVR